MVRVQLYCSRASTSTSWGCIQTCKPHKGQMELNARFMITCQSGKNERNFFIFHTSKNNFGKGVLVSVRPLWEVTFHDTTTD